MLLPTVVLVGGCSRAEDGGETQAREKAIPVVIESVEQRTFREMVHAIGTLKTEDTVEIGPEIPGVIREIHAREGEEVESGQMLFTLDDERVRRRLEEQRKALEAAKARLENIRSTYNRLRKLYGKRVIAKERWDEIQSEYTVAQAEVERLRSAVGVVREELGYTSIHAPSRGVLSEILVDPGEVVSAGRTLVTLYSGPHMEAEVRVPGLYAGRVHRGQGARIEVQAHPGTDFPGQVVFVSPAVNPRTRDFLVKVRTDSPEKLMKPGMFANVSVIMETRESPSVPEESLVPMRGGYAVFTVREGRATRRPVTIGLRRAGLAEVLDGLEPGERVVKRGHMQLENRDPVQEVKEEDVQVFQKNGPRP